MRPGNPAFLGEYTIGALRSVKGKELLAPPLGQVEVRHDCHLTSLSSLCVVGASLTGGRSRSVRSAGMFFRGRPVILKSGRKPVI